MQIERLRVDGFGQFSAFDLAGLRPGLVVVHGPNEAGKSTLRQFVRWMLFGPRRGDIQRWTGPHGRLEGELRVRLEDGVARLARQGRDVELRRSGGTTQGEGALLPLIGGMDRALFDAVFTFDLFDLQRIEALREEHVQNLLAVGATLGAGAHPAEIVQALDGESSQYWKPRAHGVRIREAEREIARIERELREARGRSERYAQIVGDVVEASGRIAALRQRMTGQVTERREVERLLRMLPSWQRRGELEALRRELGTGRARLPVETRQRLEESRRAANAALEAARLAAEEHQAAAVMRDAVAVDAALLAQAPLIDTLSARLEHVTAQADEAETHRQLVVERGLRAEAALDALGGEWDEGRLARVRLDARVEADARRHVSETAALAGQNPAELGAAERDAARVDGELEGIDGALASLPEEPVQARLADIEAVVAEASARLEDVAALAEAGARIEANAACPVDEGVSDWPEVSVEDVDEVRRHAAVWHDAVTDHAVRRRTSQEGVDEAQGALREAEAAAVAAAAMPGADAPGSELVSGLEARWLVVRDELTEWRRLDGERAQLEDRAARIPARVGGDVRREALVALDTSAAARTRLAHAYDAAAAADRSRSEAQARTLALPATEVVTLDAKAAAAEVERRNALVAARGALDDYQRARDGAPPPVATGRLAWVAVAMLSVLTAVAAVFVQFILAGLAFGCVIVMAVAALRQRRGASAVAAPDASVAEQRFLRASRVAGFETTPDRGAIDVALESTREALSRFEREAQRVDASAAEARRALEASAELREATTQRAARERELAAVLGSAGLPPGVGRALADAWFDAARELQQIAERATAVRRQLADVAQRAESFRVALCELAGGAVQSDEEIAGALAALRTMRAEAERRESALHRTEAQLAAARAALDVAETRAARVAAEAPVAAQERAAWMAWVSVKGLPPGEPDAAYLERVRAALARTTWQRELRAARAAEAAIAERVGPFEARVRELGRAAGLDAAFEGRGLDAWVAGLRKCAADARERQVRRKELGVARSKVGEEQARVAAALERAQGRAKELEALWAGFERWRGLVSAPDELRPDGALDWLERVKRARGLVAEREAAARAVVVLEEQVADFVAKVDALAGALGAAAPREFAVASLWLRERRGHLEQARLAATQRAEREERVASTDRTRRLRESTARRLAEQWRAASEEVGCADDVTWEARLASEERQDVIDGELESVGAELRGALGAQWADPERWEPWAVTGLTGLEQRARELDVAVGEATAEQEQEEKLRGTLEAQALSLETASDVMELSTALEAAIVRLDAARREWWRLRIARHLLQETFERYRQERQPAVLRQASAWFQRASAGAYEGLVVDEESSGVRIAVRGRNGAVHPAEELSTGTTGILYLCLRLALAVDQARHTAAVPLLLDDVLAHFDPERAAAAARLLAEVAAEAPELQLVLFTCRPETVACVQEVAPGTAVLEMSRWAGADGPVARAMSRTPSASPTTRTTSRPASTGAVADSDSDVDARVAEALRLLEDRDEPLARADFVDGLGLEDTEWTPLRQQLEADDRVDVSGNARGRRYALA